VIALREGSFAVFQSDGRLAPFDLFVEQLFELLARIQHALQLTIDAGLSVEKSRRVVSEAFLMNAMARKATSRVSDAPAAMDQSR
ncbi:hypothetical protein OFB80_32430, partial [Escherichia coli]|nr:hypothetical protein [Escherichia coli]